MRFLYIFGDSGLLCGSGWHAKAVRDEEKWPPLQPLKVSALVIILQPYFSRSLVRNKRPYIRLVSNWHHKESHHFSQKWWRRKGACGSMPFFFGPELCTVMCFVHFSSNRKSQFYWFLHISNYAPCCAPWLIAVYESWFLEGIPPFFTEVVVV